MRLCVRVAAPSDVPAMLEIYGPTVLETLVNWEYEVPSHDDFQQRLAKVQGSGYPWFVAEVDGVIVGYTYASSFRDRCGYRFCCESTLYMREGWRGRGLGRRLYEILLETLRRQGFAAVIAVIAHPYPESERFHERMGFRLVGVHEKIGYKFDGWRSAAFYQLDLDHPNAVEFRDPRPVSDLLALGELVDLL